jgi:hypothetical protein
LVVVVGFFVCGLFLWVCVWFVFCVGLWFGVCLVVVVVVVLFGFFGGGLSGVVYRDGTYRYVVVLGLWR